MSKLNLLVFGLGVVWVGIGREAVNGIGYSLDLRILGMSWGSLFFFSLYHSLLVGSAEVDADNTFGGGRF